MFPEAVYFCNVAGKNMNFKFKYVLQFQNAVKIRNLIFNLFDVFKILVDKPIQHNFTNPMPDWKTVLTTIMVFVIATSLLNGTVVMTTC